MVTDHRCLIVENKQEKCGVQDGYEGGKGLDSLVGILCRTLREGGIRALGRRGR